MSLYDAVHVGKRHGQVKCWRNALTYFQVGSHVGSIEDHQSYDVAMREGGYVHVVSLAIVGWDDERREHVPCFDKWGDRWVSAEINVGDVGRELRDLGMADPHYFF